MFCLLVTDDFQRSSPVARRLARRLPIHTAALSDYPENGAKDAAFLVIDIDLLDRGVVADLRERLKRSGWTKDKVFITSVGTRGEQYQANALGAALILPSDFDQADIEKLAKCHGLGRPVRSAATAIRAIDGMQPVYGGLREAVASNTPLPKAHIAESCDRIADCLGESSIAEWLQAVRLHDSYTYRHCMTVNGVAVAFAMHLGMRKVDVQRIATGALLHDIGKLRIPMSILDKPGVLAVHERAEINQHPRYGAEILRRDAQFDEEVIDIALHHHELLDGTGYPDGLVGDQIKDTVRILTIVDIYSALIDKRSYKEPIAADRAYGMLLDMGGKLDTAILRAFEPVAHAARAAHMRAA